MNPKNRFLNALIERGPLGACVINIIPSSEDFGRILYFNPQFQQMLQNSAEDMQNSFIWDYQLKTPEINLRYRLNKMALDNKFENDICIPYQLKNGSIIYLKLHLKPDETLIKYQNPTELIIFIEKLEIEQTEYNEFVEKHKQLDKINIRLKEIISGLDAIISTLGHELQNYVGGIVMLGNVLTQEIQNCKDSIISNIDKQNDMNTSDYIDFAHKTAEQIINIEELFNNIRNSSKKANNLLCDLLLYKSLQTGKHKIQLTYVDIEELITDVCKIEQPKYQQKSIELKCNFPKESAAFRADTQALTNVLLNLLSNARKFTHPNGKVSITGKLDTDCAVFIVKDNGIGIDSKKIPGLYDVSTHSPIHGTLGEEGTGLGLPICNEIINAHSGEILLETKVNKGSKFTVRIPQPTKLSESQTSE